MNIRNNASISINGCSCDHLFIIWYYIFEFNLSGTYLENCPLEVFFEICPLKVALHSWIIFEELVLNLSLLFRSTLWIVILKYILDYCKLLLDAHCKLFHLWLWIANAMVLNWECEWWIPLVSKLYCFSMVWWHTNWQTLKAKKKISQLMSCTSKGSMLSKLVESFFRCFQSIFGHFNFKFSFREMSMFVSKSFNVLML